MPEYATIELAERLGGDARGTTARVSVLTSTERAGPGCIVVAADAEALRRAIDRGAAAVVVPRGLEPPAPTPCAIIEVDDARLALALLSKLFDARPVPPYGVHPSASIAPDAELAPDVAVGPNSVIEATARVGLSLIHI